ncbi:MAG: 23S rRNA (uracil(1939)-C(5))-methyltransferase RlmD [Lachnospiraceae bacterium]|nr:23S rRNA (uracil(1939)-C(5))-methyltransferase RlmD [Lachnospiraceae bacterium]
MGATKKNPQTANFAKNDLVTVEITDIGTDGEGIGKIDGFLLFIKDAVIGDVVEAKITKTKKQYAYARVEKVLTPSPFRVQPNCEFHRQCGGCQIQAFDYKKQLIFKENKVKNNLIRIGGFDADYIEKIMEPVVGMEEPYYYRNKAQYPVGTDKEGNLITGFYAGRTHSIISNTRCHLGRRENQQILEAVLEYMKENEISAYDEEKGTGLVRHILIRSGFASGEIMVCLIINAKNFKALPAQEKLLAKLRTFPGMASVSVNLNTRRDNVIMGTEVHTIWGKPTISDTLCIYGTGAGAERKVSLGEGSVDWSQIPKERGLTFKISPLSFYQVNPVQTEKLYSLAVEYAGLTGKETVWDLYCGIGTISLFMATAAKQVYGVEIIPQAIEDAKENAAVNGLDNTDFFVGKVEEVLPKFYEKGSVNGTQVHKTKAAPSADMLHPDVIVVDPPRKGCEEACLSTMLKMAPERIVYVSCDSATLARDLKFLCEGGYELKRVRAVDQFPHTVHVESCVLLCRTDT